MRQKTNALPTIRNNPFKNRGFTIVELLIVIVIIAILAAITVVAYNGIQERARDSQRIQDIKTIEKALRIHLINEGSLPAPTSVNASWEQSNEDNYQNGDFMEALVNTNTISKVPLDPVNSSSMYYRYYRYGAGDYGCDATKGRYGVLQIVDMQTSGRPHPQSPGFSCTSRDWGGEADYTIGIYENE